jgi:hypothetical protein
MVEKRKNFDFKEKLGLGPGGFPALSESERVAILERESQEIIANGGELTSVALNKNGHTAFLAAVRRYFPDGLMGLQTRLNIMPKSTQRPRGYWQDLTKIEAEARGVIEEHGDLTANLLKEAGRSDLLGAALRNYPGGIFALKDRLMGQNRRPRGHYSSEQVEAETRAFVDKYGSLKYELMLEKGYATLSRKISEYPGGRRGITIALGLEGSVETRKPWTPERILEEAKAVYLKEGKISHDLLVKLKQSGLGSAIARRYPGGWNQIKLDLGINPDKKKLSSEQANTDLDSLMEEN